MVGQAQDLVAGPTAALQPRTVSADKRNMSPSVQLPFDYTIDTGARVVSVRATGTLTFAKIVDYASRLRVDPRFSPAFAEIVDLRLVESVQLSASEAIRLADQVDVFSFTSKRAFVAQSQAQINAGQLHRILRPASTNIRLFFSMDEARAWIRCGEGLSASAAAGV